MDRQPRRPALAGVLGLALGAFGTAAASAQGLPAGTPFSLGSPVQAPYGSFFTQFVRVYQPKSSGRVPVVVAFPDWNWSNSGPPCHVARFAARLSNAGIATVFVSLSNRRMEEAAVDVSRALRFVRMSADRFKLDTSRLAVVGCGTGGHFAGLVATDSSYLEKAGWDFKSLKAAAILNGAGLDLPKMLPALATQTDPVSRRTFRYFGKEPEAWRGFSPVAHVAAPNAPAFFITGPTETAGVQTPWLDLVKALRASGGSEVLAYQVAPLKKATAASPDQPDSLDWPELVSFIVSRTGAAPANK